ncbi:hypothetical protein N7470_008329 [Penicillium chermesinum]|nr:hypothetical protein N7470_008329 [Penicillium chermesinum]
MVLAHSLRDNGTKAKLVALFTPERLQPATVTELRTVYDELIPVNSIVNGTPANLWLMERPDLIATFTKIELWRLTQYERIVYVDCDIVALRAPDELFALDVNFAAAPDVGWPDIFNSGLMVLRPNLQDYYGLKALAERGISFDGADQGLLNMHFRDWHRLSFTYNCTPSANYQYIPAYKHFQSSISLIHFIGSQKPWNLPRQVVPVESPYNQLLSRWWSVYDRHYRPVAVPAPKFSEIIPSPYETIVLQRPSPRTVRFADQSDSTGSEQWPKPFHVHHQDHGHHDEDDDPARSHREDPNREDSGSDEEIPLLVSGGVGHHGPSPAPVLSAVPQYVRGEEHVSTFVPLQYVAPEPPTHQRSHYHQSHGHSETHLHQPQPLPPPPPVEHWERSRSPDPPAFEAPKAEWDASREPPPLHSKPEGISLDQKTYTMSQDTNLFQPPNFIPDAPKNMYYKVPENRPEPEKATKIFPWETHAPQPTRVFAEEQPTPALPPDYTTIVQSDEVEEPVLEPQTPPTRALFEPSAKSWEDYSRSNAWDEDPDIQRYIETVQQARRGKTQVVSGAAQPSSSASNSTSGSYFSSTTTGSSTETHRPSTIITDFPHGNRETYDDENDASTVTGLPPAEGVPSQADWNPLTQLEELRRLQSEVLDDPEILFKRLAALAKNDSPR